MQNATMQPDKRTTIQDTEQRAETDERCDTNDPPEDANLNAASAQDPHLPDEDSRADICPLLLSAKKPLTVFPEFLLSRTFAQDVKAFKSEIREAASRGEFSQLFPQHIARKLVQHSFTEIIPEPHFISLRTFMQILDAQYADDIASPGQDVARWAMVNGILALAGRFKTAAGAEEDMSPITLSFYRNATLVLHQLIGQTPSLISAQAMLIMAMFARGIPDIETFIMLTSNASNQLELLEKTWSLTIPVVSLWQKEEFIRTYRFASQLSQEARRVMTQGIEAHI
ncbi:hypothetical protein ONZ43_g2530 [Nemania bipapillata]|uniref:Uncharacterized protein n=1 Tax=Nemania bipapillata TaxID=110536 RepID=A0ACC2J0A2_9PEZI|nr:hypothetical protein ONZ43_g2530 [Nemania bipapillata]